MVDKTTMVRLTTILAIGFIAIISVAEVGLIVIAAVRDGSTVGIVTDTLVKILFGAIAVFGPVATSIIHVFGSGNNNSTNNTPAPAPVPLPAPQQPGQPG